MPALRVDSVEDLGFPQLLRVALKMLAVQYEEQENRRVWLDEQPERLHSKIRELQGELSEYLPPIERLHFLDRGPFPYSREIAEALEILQQSGAINRENPNYTRFSPKIFADTKETIGAEVDELFPEGSVEREALKQFINGLTELVSEE